jgi:hypothetical protein
VVLEAFAALDRSEIPNEAEAPIAHSSQSTMREATHAASMHQVASASILDRITNGLSAFCENQSRRRELKPDRKWLLLSKRVRFDPDSPLIRVVVPSAVDHNLLFPAIIEMPKIFFTH